jgi:hypothetical protein
LRIQKTEGKIVSPSLSFINNVRLAGNRPCPNPTIAHPTKTSRLGSRSSCQAAPGIRFQKKGQPKLPRKNHAEHRRGGEQKGVKARIDAIFSAQTCAALPPARAGRSPASRDARPGHRGGRGGGGEVVHRLQFHYRVPYIYFPTYKLRRSAGTRLKPIFIDTFLDI